MIEILMPCLKKEFKIMEDPDKGLISCWMHGMSKRAIFKNGELYGYVECSINRCIDPNSNTESIQLGLGWRSSK